MIGIFDSGIGGLSVVSEIKKINNRCPVTYFGDTARYPWGSKSKKTVISYADEICRFFIDQNINEIVIACNTASSFATEYLIDKYPEVKFHNVIDPVIKRVKNEISLNKNMTIGVIGTTGTIESQVYYDKIRSLNRNLTVISRACPLFVPLVEEGYIDHKATRFIAEEYLSVFKGKISTLILGCTHYPYLEKIIREILGEDVELISSAKELATEITGASAAKKSPDIYYFSDLHNSPEKIIKRISGNNFKILKKTF